MGDSKKWNSLVKSYILPQEYESNIRTCPQEHRIEPSYGLHYIPSRFSSVQFISVGQLCPTLCDPENRSTRGLPVHHQFPEFTQTLVQRVSDAIQPSHALSSPSPLAPNPSQHQSLCQWVNSSHEVAKVLEFQPQHQSLMPNHLRILSHWEFRI